MIVNIVSPAEWSLVSEKAHLVLFNEFREASLDRIDFVIVITDEGDIPLGYITVREVDAKTAYVQYGGVFPSCAKTGRAVRVYAQAMKKLSEKYQRATTLIQNTNIPMLKLAMAFGWIIRGMRVFENEIYLEHQIEFQGGEI